MVAEHCEQSLEDLLRERKPVRYCVTSGNLNEKQKFANKDRVLVSSVTCLMIKYRYEFSF